MVLNESKPSGGLKRPMRQERGVDFEVGDVEPSASFAVAIFDVLRAAVGSKGYFLVPNSRSAISGTVENNSGRCRWDRLCGWQTMMFAGLPKCSYSEDCRQQSKHPRYAQS